MKYNRNDPLLLNFFKDEKLRIHLIQQLDLISQFEPVVKVIEKKIKIYRNIEITTQNNQKQIAKFLIVITKSYPIQPPKVYLLNQFVIPRINDYQDLLERIIKTKWYYMLKLQNIFNNLQQFCRHIKGLEERPLELQRVGKYYPGQIRTKQQLNQFQFQRFSVIQKSNKKDDKKYLLGISQFHILLWKQNQNKLQLQLAAAIQSVKEIQVSRQGQIILKIRKFQNIKQFNIITKQFVFQNSELQNQFVKYLLKNITTLQSLKISIQPKNQDTNEIINKQLKNIKLKQDELAKNPMNKIVYNDLTRLYQQTIDYYSLRGDYFYLIYVYKMNSLFKIVG